MFQQRNPHVTWLLLFVIGIGLDTIGMVIIGPIWLRYGFILTGVLLLLLSIAEAGHLQRSK